MMKKKKLVGLVGAGMAVLSLAGSSAYWWLQQKKGGVAIQVPAYRVVRVIDGDTFETTERQLVRLAGIMAPELQYCGGQEAKVALEKLITGKSVYFKVLYRDKYFRLDSLVYAGDKYVNEELVKSGFATYKLTVPKSPETEILRLAGEAARAEKVGVYGPGCTQLVNPDNPKCSIKGNVREDIKYYHYPGCGQYNNTDMQLYLGDQWFCTEAEARKAGFKKASLCP